MTEAQWAALESYVFDLKARLDLRDWEIQIEKVQPEAPDALACIDVIYGRRLAVLKVCHDFADVSPAKRRHALTHELVHCHLDRADSVVRSLREAIGTLAFSVLHENHKLAIEDGTDAIASVIAPFMPLCELPSAESKADESVPAG